MASNVNSSGKKVGRYIIWIIWVMIICSLLSVYIKLMVPNHKGYIVNNPYTIDSVWEAEGNNWHNDVLLYTLFQNKPVHIHPDSWYFDYVSAFSDYVIADETITAQINSRQIDMSDFTYLNHILAAAHDTLFDEQAKTVITTKTAEGAADLFIAEDSLAAEDEIIVVHDELGNLYLKGYSNE